MRFAVFAAALGFVCAVSACAAARTQPQPQPATTVPPPLPGTQPLKIAAGAPFPVASPAPRAVLDGAFPAELRGAKIAAAANGTAYAVAGEKLYAVDLATGALRWHGRETVQPETVTAADAIVYATLRTGSTEIAYAGFDATSGRRAVTLPGAYRGWILNGVLYATEAKGFTARDAATGRLIWRTFGAGSSPGENPVLAGTTLLQDFWDSGATMVNAIYAFDVRDGRALWSRANGPHPIGYGDGIVYLNTTWCGSMTSCFHSLDVDAVDLATGKSRNHASYVLDDVTDTGHGNGMYAATDAHVAGGYVYFVLHGRTYRYVAAGRNPAPGEGAILEGVLPRAWFDDGALLVTRGDELDVARSYADRLELRRVAAGAPRSPVIASAGGTRYAVAGEQLVAVDRSASSARIVGRVPCSSVSDLIAWASRVAARCAAAGERGAERLLVFEDPAADAVPPPAPAAHPVAPPPPELVLRLHGLGGSLPERSSVGNIAPGPGGSLALALNRTPFDASDAIARVSRAGAVSVVPLPRDDDRVEPRAIAVDAHGTVWFNDDRHATLTSLDAAGRFTTHLIGEPRVNSPRSRSAAGIRVAIGPDGEAWFARSHPTPQIGRVTGGPRYDVPPEIGDMFALRAGSDGALWFLTPKEVGRMTPSGAFAHVPLPPVFAPERAYGMRMAPGAAGTMWLANDRTIVQMKGASVVRTLTLPNATIRVNDLVTACDGSLYVAESVPQLAHVTTNGRIEEYPLDRPRGVTSLARGDDCRIWLNGYGNSGPELVTVELVRAPRAAMR